MEITGKIIKVLEPLSGVSAKNGDRWVKNSFVIETGGQYPKHTVFTVFGEDRWKQMGITVGGTYAVSFDIDAREYKGKWYNDVSAWKAVRVDAAAQQPSTQSIQQQPQQQQSQQQQTEEGGLPF